MALTTAAYFVCPLAFLQPICNTVSKASLPPSFNVKYNSFEVEFMLCHLLVLLKLACQLILKLLK